MNNFDRGPPRDHSCEVWSKSNKRFQRRCCLKKLLTHGRTDGRTHARTDDGRRTLKDRKSSLSTSCSGELIKRVVCNLKLTDTSVYLPCVVENERGCKFITGISKVRGSSRDFIEDEDFVIKHKLLNAVRVMIHSVVHTKVKKHIDNTFEINTIF